MTTVKSYLSLIKFSHTIFALPFAIIGFCLAAKDPIVQQINTWRGLPNPVVVPTLESKPMWVIFILVLLCMVFARSAAMAFNRYLDSDIDALNPRTAVREIPLGIISKKNALGFTILNALLFIITCYFINRICFYLSPVALLVILFYSYTKRFTALCHLILGLGLSLAPIGAYLAVTGKFDEIPLLFSFAVLFWVSGFDIIYALQDEAFDKQQQLHSIPSLLGKPLALNVSVLFHILSSVAVITAGLYGSFGLWYWVGVLVFVGMLVYQHSLVKPNDLSKVNLAFMTSNGIASVVFAFFVLIDLFI